LTKFLATSIPISFIFFHQSVGFYEIYYFCQVLLSQIFNWARNLLGLAEKNCNLINACLCFFIFASLSPSKFIFEFIFFFSPFFFGAKVFSKI
jgi:hypothetical protein